MVFIERRHRLDIRLLLWCGKSRHYPKLLHLIRAVSHSGDGYAQAILPLLLWLFEPTQGGVIVKPCLLFSNVIQASDKFSSLSGHSMASFCLASISCLHYGSYAEPLFVWAVAVASARVLLGGTSQAMW